MGKKKSPACGGALKPACSKSHLSVSKPPAVSGSGYNTKSKSFGNLRS
jgi:hypothetical protein